jgi:hypothetical protein
MNRPLVTLDAEPVNQWLDNDLKEEAITNLLNAHFDKDHLS